ncbi:MFS transporter [Streptomyces jumonjinensis]|uniref:MFS transporter n=1 Tax=Streptomyces jumonjinensis TaxID=1945 RepID=UPI00379B678A
MWTPILAAGYPLTAPSSARFYAPTAAIGLVLGGSHESPRSLFSHPSPRGEKAEHSSARETSDRGLSWPGPLFFGLAHQLTGGYRDAPTALALVFGRGFPRSARAPWPVRQPPRAIPRRTEFRR